MARHDEPLLTCTPIPVQGGVAIACAPKRSNCWACDSSVPHGVPEMIVTSKGRTYCSEDCLDDWERHLDEQDERQRLKFAQCPECGYDNQEHNPGKYTKPCSKSSRRDRRREGMLVA